MTVATILAGERSITALRATDLLRQHGLSAVVLGEVEPRILSLEERVRFFCGWAQYTFAVVDAGTLMPHLSPVLEAVKERARPALILCPCARLRMEIGMLASCIETTDAGDELGAAYIEVFIDRHRIERRRGCVRPTV